MSNTIRKIIKIDEKKCTGCGLCVYACHEGALALKDGKAVLLRDDYCDGLGDCLPACPEGAISFEMRAALPYDEVAVEANIAKKTNKLPCGCPASMSMRLKPIQPMQPAQPTQPLQINQSVQEVATPVAGFGASALGQWPVQIKLAPANAPYFNGANLLIAADCAAYAHGNFHNEFISGRVTLIGCPKLDAGDYSVKLAEIFKLNDIHSITVARMSVPCCGGLASAVKRAIDNCGKKIPLRVVVISPNGEVLE